MFFTVKSFIKLSNGNISVVTKSGNTILVMVGGRRTEITPLNNGAAVYLPYRIFEKLEKTIRRGKTISL